MQKIIYKLIIMILLFVLSAGYFISNIKEEGIKRLTSCMVMGRRLTVSE